MTYEELKKAYEKMSEKCSELEKEIQKNKQVIEDKNLEIENLTEQLLKRNQMLFGKKAERSKNLYIDGQMSFDESFLVNWQMDDLIFSISLDTFSTQNSKQVWTQLYEMEQIYM